MKYSHWMCLILKSSTGGRVSYIADIPKSTEDKLYYIA
jgi:hypothetical protein